MAFPRVVLGAVFLSALSCVGCDKRGDIRIPTHNAAGPAPTVVFPPPGLHDAGAAAPQAKASKSGSVAITQDDAFVVMANPDDGSVSVFRTSDNTRTAKVATGSEPWSVAIHPDGDTAFVANRAGATVVKVTGIRTATPVVSTPVPVGSEPAGLALTPTGAKLFVAEFAEGRITVITTADMMVTGHIDAPLNPRALAVTNNGDTNDNDETLVVPEFFGEPNAAGEASDVGRTGRVRLYNVSDLQPQAPILLQPIDSGFVPTGTTAGTVMTSPNQLFAVAVRAGKVYVTSVSASPQPPPRFDGNVFPVVYVGDLASHTEVRTGAGTTNLARVVFDTIDGGTRFALGEIVDIDFADDTTAYVVSRAADVVQRVSYAGGAVTIGSAQVKQIAVAGSLQSPLCQNPVGIAVSHGGTRAYLNCWVTRKLAVIDLSTQALLTTVESTAAPDPDGGAAAVQRGKRFYFTGLARWSSNGQGWSSCGSCHPDGLTDNITWSFAAGPRQSTSMDGTFSHGTGTAGKQRVLNWTAIFDELHDFEGNTRGVSGGKGAITTAAPDGGTCGGMALQSEVPTALPTGLGSPVKDLQARAENCTKADWDEINEFTKTIRPPSGRKVAPVGTLDVDAVARGRAQFIIGGCGDCHGGAGWTVSRLFYTPSADTNAALADGGLVRPQPASVDPGPDGGPIAPAQVACVLRSVGTFGVPDADGGVDTAIEKKADGTRAQGLGGFNPPSLYGLSVGAPYFHHGQAKTLQELFDDPRWATHLKAGNAAYAPDAPAKTDLITFLLSIDATTPEIPLVGAAEMCPTTFP